jgi:hypothetical protein
MRQRSAPTDSTRVSSRFYRTYFKGFFKCKNFYTAATIHQVAARGTRGRVYDLAEVARLSFYAPLASPQILILTPSPPTFLILQAFSAGKKSLLSASSTVRLLPNRVWASQRRSIRIYRFAHRPIAKKLCHEIRALCFLLCCRSHARLHCPRRHCCPCGPWIHHRFRWRRRPRSHRYPPAASDPSQFDSDNDHIGDAIDPTPLSPGPFININFALTGSYTVPAGAGVTINYTTGTAPVANFGYIELFLQPSSSPDAYVFQSLATPGGSFFIPAGLVTIPGLWDLNTPGTYNVEAWAFGPGVDQGYKGGAVQVTVVPEPATLTLLAAASAGLFLVRRRKS